MERLSSPRIVVVQGGETGEQVFEIQGALEVQGLSAFVGKVRAETRRLRPSRLVLDLSGLRRFDSSAALAVLLARREAGKLGAKVEVVGTPPKLETLSTLFRPESVSAAPEARQRPKNGVISQMGSAAWDLADDFQEVFSFVGALLRASGRTLLRPGRLRWNEVFYYMERVGVNGFPIVALISFLLGLIMAFMSSLQLRQFGANIYVASLVGIAMVRELGPIMTAILVAGRSGSAFAAEIGTMRVNEEVDALQVMGIEPVGFLAVPKLLATMTVLPILTLFADLFAIVGGLLVGALLLDVTVYAYVQQTLKTMTAFDIVAGQIKAVVFAMIIACIGSQRGFQVRGGAADVGTATTSAVVTSMFLIIVVDSLFAVALHYVRWG